MSRTGIGILVAGVCVLLVVAAFRLAMHIRNATAQDEKMTSLFVADPKNVTAVVVRGWRQEELERILQDFRQSYGLRDPSSFRVEAKSSEFLTVTFPGDIQPKLFLFLINYIQYPRGFDLANRHIGVLGHVVLTPAFGLPDTQLVGQRAAVYVPADDTEYDVVYAQVESGRSFRIPFTTLIWHPSDDARKPL